VEGDIICKMLEGEMNTMYVYFVNFHNFFCFISLAPMMWLCKKI
jgi:hypothetical protein